MTCVSISNRLGVVYQLLADCRGFLEFENTDTCSTYLC